MYFLVNKFFVFVGMYYIVVIFEIGLVIVVICVVLNFYYSKIKMFGWMCIFFLKIMVFVFRVNIRLRYFFFKDNQFLKEVLYVYEVVYNLVFDLLNIIDGGCGWGGIIDVFE